MGTSFVIMAALKLCAMGGIGISSALGLQYFHEFKLSKKSKGSEEDGIGENLRKKSQSIL
jgi:hypothetical protein